MGSWNIVKRYVAVGISYETSGETAAAVTTSYGGRATSRFEVEAAGATGPMTDEEGFVSGRVLTYEFPASYAFWGEGFLPVPFRLDC
jgi:hypothetical protein